MSQPGPATVEAPPAGQTANMSREIMKSDIYGFWMISK